MTTQFKIGDTVYLKASPAVFDAITCKTGPRRRSGPLTVERVYKCGNHWRVKATTQSGNYNYHDGAVGQFEVEQKAVVAVSPYLNRPTRSLTQAIADTLD